MLVGDLPVICTKYRAFVDAKDGWGRTTVRCPSLSPVWKANSSCTAVLTHLTRLVGRQIGIEKTCDGLSDRGDGLAPGGKPEAGPAVSQVKGDDRRRPYALQWISVV